MQSDRETSSVKSVLSTARAERSWWRVLLPLVWLGLGARIAVALARHESLQNDFLSLALIVFLMVSAVLGSRVWLWFHERGQRFRRAPA